MGVRRERACNRMTALVRENGIISLYETNRKKNWGKGCNLHPLIIPRVRAGRGCSRISQPKRILQKFTRVKKRGKRGKCP